MKRKSTLDQYGNYFEVEENKGWLTVSIKLKRNFGKRQIPIF
jgi:hypothetical protein